jgi:hypothetical protein
MIQLKNLLTLILSASMVLIGNPAQASTNPLRGALDYLNYNNDVAGFAGPLKTQFKTQEDHRQIDSLIASLADTTKKWVWRFEVQEGKQIAFRVNGKVQWTMTKLNIDDNKFEINGQEVQLRPGESFLSFQTKLTQILNKKSASLESIFINEAHAILPFLVVGGLAAAGIFAATRASAAAPSCPAVSNAIASYENNRTNRSQRFRRGTTCRDMPTDYQRRIEMVSRNFNWNEKFNARPNPHQFPHNEACVDYYAGSGDRARALQICKCIDRKQLSCDRGGWNMLPPNPPYLSPTNPPLSYSNSMAAQTCEAGYQHNQNQCGQRPATPTPPPGNDPYGDVPNVGKGGTTTPPPTYDTPPPSYDDPYGDVPGPGKGGQAPSRD